MVRVKEIVVFGGVIDMTGGISDAAEPYFYYLDFYVGSVAEKIHLMGL